MSEEKICFTLEDICTIMYRSEISDLIIATEMCYLAHLTGITLNYDELHRIMKAGKEAANKSLKKNQNT